MYNDFNNIHVAALPRHLKQYIVPQHYERYTAIDHAVWRYVMRQNYSYLKEVAYYPYIKGLERAGLSIEHIPDLQTMNDNLSEIGWGAVAVDGFIPPAIFMEFQEYKVLVIAADIRQLNHIEYTPTPDIIHESAGHAPIIADPDYNNYLSYFGSIGAKAMFSSKDYDLYEAIRDLSVLKELPNSSEEAIKKAEVQLDYCFKNLGEPSEMALLSRLHWWSVEYGLIGTLEQPKIYGAGLLSSIGESVSCMQPEVKKLWYNIDTANQAYDITKAQPQLFVTPNFQNLIKVLEEFADTMAFRRGGIEGIRKAIDSRNVATAVYSSGLQLSGVFTDVVETGNDEVGFIKTIGPSALSFENKQLPGHGKDYHKDGFSSPVGKLKNNEKSLEDFDEMAWRKIGVFVKNEVQLEFESGVEISGTVINLVRKNNKTLLISFENCRVTQNNELLFKPEWGVYDMAVGDKIISVFNGHADKDNYEIIVASNNDTPKIVYDKKTIDLQKIYQQIRDIRIQKNNYENLAHIWRELQQKHSDDWLAPLEILEILLHEKIQITLAQEIRTHLTHRAENENSFSKLITDGLTLIDAPEIKLVVH
ncbi:aromatic amino acid hydroxylase [Arachidicoccus sp.]|uniref:aromatic amino acid hydroxylase n=1 Tax=Arachidicoccus sp. TaxID=1872624 RepID=UPI003D1ED307